MILVNIRQSGQRAVTDDQVREAAAGDWSNISDAALDRHGDVLLAVRGNRVVGAWRIGGHQRVNEGKVRFHLREDPVLGGWAGHDSPVKWRRGQANPVAYAESSANPPEANKSAGAATHRRTPAAARRRTHRITIETYDLGDDAAARLHHTLLTVAGLTGKLCDCRATSLVGEIERAKTELNYNYSSAANPPALRGQVSGSRG